MLLKFFLNHFEMVPLSPIITGITYVFTFHMPCIPIVKSAYFKILSVSLLNRFLSPEISTFTNIQVLFHFTHYDVWFIVRNGSISLPLFML